MGQDVVQLLTDALNRRTDMTHEVVVEAVVNDSVGTMMTCAYNNQDCSIGIIIGETKTLNPIVLFYRCLIILTVIRLTIEGRHCLGTCLQGS